MANKSCSIESINKFIIDNFIPYAWADMWELEGIDTNNVFRFRMEVRPNYYERMKWDEYISLNDRIHPHHYRNTCAIAGGKYWQHQLPPVSLDSDYRICIPMVLDRITKKGIRFGKDKKLKYHYCSTLSVRALTESQKLDNPPPFELNNSREIVFGKNLSKVKSYIKGNPRKDWAFI